MPIRNANFYNLQSFRRYPLDDTASGVGDDGAKLFDDIIVDCNISWPRSLGAYAFLSALTVSANIVTVVFLAADSPTAVNGFRPMASISLQRPVEEFRQYQLEAMWPGVSGSIVFGDVGEFFVGRYSTPGQGLLAPRCGRPYRDLPIPTLRKHQRSTGLGGVVQINAGQDLEIVREDVSIEGCIRSAIVIRLVNNIANRNILSTYIGPCDNRPESRNCLNGEGIEEFAGVKPDCSGNIVIAVNGIAATMFKDCGDPNAGMVLDTDLELGDVCEARTPDRFPGVDRCFSSASASASSGSSGSQSSGSASDSQTSESSASCTELPFTDDFDNAEARFFTVKIGTFVFRSADSPDEINDGNPTVSAISAGLGVISYAADDLSRRNVSVLDACGLGSSLERKVTVDVLLTNEGDQVNGGVAINYHIVDPLTDPHPEYFWACLNRSQNEIQLYRFNGGALVKIAGVAPASPIVLNHWYRLTAEVSLFSPGQVAITVAVSGITVPGWPGVTFSTLTNRFGDDDGFYGVATDRARALFSFFQLEVL